jgi:hypothetical protein
LESILIIGWSLNILYWSLSNILYWSLFCYRGISLYSNIWNWFKWINWPRWIFTMRLWMSVIVHYNCLELTTTWNSISRVLIYLSNLLINRLLLLSHYINWIIGIIIIWSTVYYWLIRIILNILCLLWNSWLVNPLNLWWIMWNLFNHFYQSLFRISSLNNYMLFLNILIFFLKIIFIRWIFWSLCLLMVSVILVCILW